MLRNLKSMTWPLAGLNDRVHKISLYVLRHMRIQNIASHLGYHLCIYARGSVDNALNQALQYSFGQVEAVSSFVQ